MGTDCRRLSDAPCYVITFSQGADGCKRRRRAEHYDDFRMLPDETKEAILFSP
jgi:hypothetical protein